MRPWIHPGERPSSSRGGARTDPRRTIVVVVEERHERVDAGEQALVAAVEGPGGSRGADSARARLPVSSSASLDENQRRERPCWRWKAMW